MASDSSDHSSPQVRLSSTASDVQGEADGQGSPQGSSGTSTAPLSKSRKRRTPGSVTLNACTNCKKARSKCDGRKPACSRCVNRHQARACVYEMHSKAAKDQMMAEIERLRTENMDLTQRHHALGEKNDLLESVVECLKDDHQSKKIMHHLKRGEPLRSIASRLGRPLIANLSNVSPESERQLNAAIKQYRQRWVESQDPCFWTNVTDDPVLIEHLVTLYLTWIHPLHILFDEEEFLSSFRTCEDVYCSASLVNAICAMACLVLRSEWRTDDGVYRGIDHLQSRFMDEVEQLQRDVEAPKLVAIQTWAIMFLVELGRGNGLMASAHLRNSTELLIAKTENEQAETSAEVASWGILTLATTWSGLIYQKPNAPVSPHALVFRDVPIDRIGSLARPGRHSDTDGDAVRPDHSLKSAYEQAKLYRIVHEVLLLYCGSRGRVTGSHMISIYERLLAWKQSLPTASKSDDGTSHHLLYLYIQYHVIVIQTLQPMLHTENTDKESGIYLTRTIVQHAQAGFNLLVQYCEEYDVFHQSPVQLFCVVHICDALVRYNPDDPAISEVVSFGLRSLEEASLGYPLAKVLRDVFRSTTYDRHLNLPAKMARELEGKSPYLPHDIQNTFTRSTYEQPITQLLPALDESLGRDFAALLEKRQHPDHDAMQTDGDEGLDAMRIRSVLNQEDSF